MSAYPELGVRWLLAGVFLVSLCGKIRSRPAYAAFVAASGSLVRASPRRAAVVAAATIVAELGTTIALALDPFGLLAAIALIGCFTAALVAAARRGGAGPCHCLGATSTPVGAHHIVRNLVLIGAAAAGWAASLHSAGGQLDPAVLAVVGLGAVFGVLVTAGLDDLVEVLR